MADFTMERDEVLLAFRFLGLRWNRWGLATRNRHRVPRRADRPALERLLAKEQAAAHEDGQGYKLTARGLDQLRLQAGEIRFRA